MFKDDIRFVFDVYFDRDGSGLLQLSFLAVSSWLNVTYIA